VGTRRGHDRLSSTIKPRPGSSQNHLGGTLNSSPFDDSDAEDGEHHFVRDVNGDGMGDNGIPGHNHGGLCFDQDHALELFKLALTGKGRSADGEALTEEGLKQVAEKLAQYEHEQALQNQIDELKAEAQEKADLLERKINEKIREHDENHAMIKAAQDELRQVKEQDLLGQIEVLKEAMREPKEDSGAEAEAAKLAHIAAIEELTSRLDALHRSSEARITEIHSTHTETVRLLMSSHEKAITKMEALLQTALENSHKEHIEVLQLSCSAVPVGGGVNVSGGSSSSTSAGSSPSADINKEEAIQALMKTFEKRLSDANEGYKKITTELRHCK